MTPLPEQILAVPADPQLARAPRIVVVAGGGGDLLALYRTAATRPPCRAGRPAQAIVRTDRLNSPDGVSVTGIDRQPGSTCIELRIRRHIGPMAANDPSYALIRVELALPRTGPNEIRLVETVIETGDAVDTPPSPPHEEHLTFHCD